MSLNTAHKFTLTESQSSIILYILEDYMSNINIIYAGMPGGWEIALIALVILLIFGAKRLPGLARGLGQGIREFKGAVDGVKDELNDVQDSIDNKDENKES